MKERRRKSKRQDSPAAASPPKISPLDRFRTYADGPQGWWTVPAAVALLTLLLGVWTFDAKLSLSGDNTEFITLARSMAAGEGLVHINSPDPQQATKYTFAFSLLWAPLERLFPGDCVHIRTKVLVLFASGLALLCYLV